MRRSLGGRLLGALPFLWFAALAVWAHAEGSSVLFSGGLGLGFLCAAAWMARDTRLELDALGDTVRWKGRSLGRCSTLERVECRTQTYPGGRPHNPRIQRELFLVPLGDSPIRNGGRVEMLWIASRIADHAGCPWEAPSDWFTTPHTDFSRWLGAQLVPCVAGAGWAWAAWRTSWPPDATAIAFHVAFASSAVTAWQIRTSLLLDLERGLPGTRRLA